MKNVFIIVTTIMAITTTSQIHAEEKGYFATMFEDFKSGGFDGVSQRKNIRDWYKKNSGKLVIVDGSERLGCEKRQGFTDVYDCSFTAEFINHTNDELSALVLKIKVYNKLKNALVTEDVAKLDISIYPTVKKNIKAKFISEKVGRSRSQLGDNFSWNYDLIAYLPDQLHGSYRDPNWSTNGSGIFRNEVYDWLAE